MRTYLKNLEQYRRNRSLDARARMQVAEFGAYAAAEAMWTLNHQAKKGWRRGAIYGLKTLLIRALYERFGAVVTEHVQTQRCWGTSWGGCYDDCPKCDGTGVYRTNRLYHFEFRIGDVPFRWHQPRSLVDWPVEVAGDPVKYEERSGWLYGHVPEAELRERSDLHLAVIRAYLVGEGVDAARDLRPANSTLGEALRADAEHAWWELTYPVRSRWRQAKEWWRDRRAPAVAYAPEGWDEDDIPF